MLATIIKVVLVLVGSAVGLLFKNLISEKLMSIITQALVLCVLGIGISNMIGTENMLCVIVCMVIGTVIGHTINIEGRLERGGELLRIKVTKGNGSSRLPRALSMHLCCSVWGPWPSPVPLRQV